MSPGDCIIDHLVLFKDDLNAMEKKKIKKKKTTTKQDMDGGPGRVRTIRRDINGALPTSSSAFKKKYRLFNFPRFHRVNLPRCGHRGNLECSLFIYYPLNCYCK